VHKGLIAGIVYVRREGSVRRSHNKR